MTFVMGFYVSIVVNRWWQQWLSFPWPDRAALAISTYVEGKDEQSRKVRRSLIRYLSLTSLLVLQSVSKAAKRRFPTLQHLVAAGLLSERELKYLLQTPTPHGFYYIPCSWFAQLARQAMKDGQVQDTISLKALIDEMQLFRGNCGSLFGYDWISVPLVYTQVVTLSVYAYFGAALFGNQMIISHNETESNVTNELPHHYFPFFTILQFFFYVGWLKVAEQLINPLGEDDDDFEVNYLIDRCVQVGYLMVDDMYGKYPPLERDTYWSNAEPEIPYTEGTVNSRIEPFLGSVADVHVNGRDSAWADTQEHILQRNENQAIQHEEGKPNLPASISSRRSFLQRIFRSLDHLNMPRKTSDSSMSILPSHRKRKKFPIFGRNLSRRSSNSSDSYKNLTGRSSPQSIESNIFDDHDDCESLDSLTLEGGSQNQKAAEFGIKNPDEPSADVPTVPAENYHIQGDMGLDTGRKDSLLPTIVENETLANVQSTAYKTFNLPNNVQYNF